MAQFLVEAYVGRTSGSDLTHVLSRLRLSAEALAASTGIPIRYLRSILVPGDETCFYLFESASIDAVKDLCTHAELTFHRVTEAIEPAPSKGGVR